MYCKSAFWAQWGSQFQQLDLALQAELADRKAHAPHAAPLSPQIYGLGVQQRVETIRANALGLSRGGSHVMRDPSLMECTFRPQTNFSLRRKPRPASAPKQQATPAAFDLSEYEDLLARYGLNPMCGVSLSLNSCNTCRCCQAHDALAANQQNCSIAV